MPSTTPPRIQRNTPAHRRAALTAATGAAALLALFERDRPDDRRPRAAIAAIRAWAGGRRELSMAEVRALSLGAHAAARAARSDAARFAARAAGHAVATWHVPRHAAGVPYYAAKARTAAAAARAATLRVERTRSVKASVAKIRAAARSTRATAKAKAKLPFKETGKPHHRAGVPPKK